MMKRLFSSAVFLCFVFIAAGCGSATPAPSEGRKDVIFFYSGSPNAPEINILSLENLSVTRFQPDGIPQGASVSIPVWSEPNQRFYTTVQQGNVSDIYSFDRDGKNTANLTRTQDTFETNPVPSPDGRYIAYETYLTKPEVWTMGPDGKNPKSLTAKNPDSAAPSWSSDSRYLYFSSSIEGTPNIFRMTADGKDVVNISKGIGLDAAYSMMGDQLVFDSDREGQMDIFLVDLKGEAIQDITNSPSRDVEPKISPDGKKVLFRSQVDEEGWDYFVLDLESGGQTRLTDSPDQFKANAVWGSDSKKIFFNMYVGEFFDVFSLDLASRKLTNLTNTPSSNEYAPQVIQLPE